MSLSECPEQVLCDVGPFAGLTIDKARVVNSALIGRRVVAAGGRYPTGRTAREYVFGGVILPDPEGYSHRWGVAGPCGPGDLLLWSWCTRSAARALSSLYEQREDCGRTSTTWVISACLIETFHVCHEAELSPCERCGAWVRQDQLRDDAWYGREFGSSLVCRDCWTDDGGPDLWWVR